MKKHDFGVNFNVFGQKNKKIASRYIPEIFFKFFFNHASRRPPSLTDAQSCSPPDLKRNFGNFGRRKIDFGAEF